jgi:hypothetical protein
MHGETMKTNTFMQEPVKLKWRGRSIRVYSYIADNCVVRREKLRFLIAPGREALYRDTISHQLTTGSGHFEFTTLSEFDTGDREV